MKSIVILTVSSALLAGCTFKGEKPDGSGTIECTQVRIAPLVGGRIVKLPPQEGAALKKGDLVALIDAKDYEFKRDEASNRLAQVQAHLDLLLAGARDEDIARAMEMKSDIRGS